VDFGGTYNLASGTSSATSLVVSSGTLTRVAGSYRVDLVDLDAATMDFQPGDSVDSLTLTGSSVFATGTALAALELQTIDIDGTSVLSLGSFDGTDSFFSGWGLRVTGNVVSQLQGYVTGGNLLGANAEELIVAFQDGNTYVTAVPEPSTLALAAAGGLLAGWRTLRRRRVAG
jgi:hypothetical protein